MRHDTRRRARPFARVLVFLGLAAAASPTWAASGIEAIMATLASTATSEQVQQVEKAIAASGHLKHDLDELVASGKLSAILIVQREELLAVRGARFSAYLDGTRLVIAAPLLKELANNLLFDVVLEGDIRPNNTTFVLAHLAYHLQTGADMAALDADIRRRIDALAATPGMHDAAPIANEGAAKRIAAESKALIGAWNDVIDAATSGNRGLALTARQTGSVLMNLRYRGIFIKAMRDHALKFGNDGSIEASGANVVAMAKALASTELMDVE